MRRDDQRVAAPVQIEQNLHHLATGAAVERPRRLVGQNDRAAVHQGARDADALLLAARKLIGTVVEALSKAKSREQFSRAHMAGRFRDAGVDRGNFDIGARGELRQQIVALKNETEPIAPQRRQLRRIERGRLAPVKAVDAGTRPIETAQYIQQRRFAGARGAHQRDHLARADFEIDVAQRIELLIAHHVTP